MRTGTVLVYRDDDEQPWADVALADGERVRLFLDRGGLVITRLAGAGRPAALLFEADPDLTSRLCAGLFRLETTPKPTPLRILVAAVVQLRSAEDIGSVFQHAAQAC